MINTDKQISEVSGDKPPIIDARAGIWKKSGGRLHCSVGQNECENLASRNSPSFAVALNCGMGSNSLKADVNAFERLQIVRARNSSYSDSK